jgi:hypothetical protein
MGMKATPSAVTSFQPAQLPVTYHTKVRLDGVSSAYTSLESLGNHGCSRVVTSQSRRVKCHGHA